MVKYLQLFGPKDRKAVWDDLEHVIFSQADLLRDIDKTSESGSEELEEEDALSEPKDEEEEEEECKPEDTVCMLRRAKSEGFVRDRRKEEVAVKEMETAETRLSLREIKKLQKEKLSSLKKLNREEIQFKKKKLKKVFYQPFLGLKEPARKSRGYIQKTNYIYQYL